jgi:hypothetical protein
MATDAIRDSLPRSQDRRGQASTAALPDRRQRGFRLGKVRGVEIRLDWSLLFVGLITVNLGAGLFPAQHPDWSLFLVWGLALAAAALFLASVLAHELAHALVGRRQGVPVRSVRQFVALLHHQRDVQTGHVLPAGAIGQFGPEGEDAAGLLRKVRLRTTALRTA